VVSGTRSGSVGQREKTGAQFNAGHVPPVKKGLRVDGAAAGWPRHGVAAAAVD
jgi:hypothetical protein